MIPYPNDFALRPDEHVLIHEQPPGCHRWFAVQLRSVSFPDGRRLMATRDGLAVDESMLLACERDAAGVWRWLRLTTPSHVYLCDMLLGRIRIQRDRWYYVEVYSDNDLFAEEDDESEPALPGASAPSSEV
jgi:hypothetical protein